MAAPKLAESFGPFVFAVISAIAFTTILGTVSGLIMAASGTVVHDLASRLLGHKLDDAQQVKAGKMTAVVVCALAMVLGVAFQKLNASVLVGWAFSIAASANLPALVLTLFWKSATRRGIAWGIVVGLVTSLGWVLLSGDAFEKLYELKAAQSPMPFSEPGIVTIPLAFVVAVVVSLLTRPKGDAAPAPAGA